MYASNSLCHDPRDKVYGIQSVLPPSLRTEVDYSKSVLEVYLDTARSWSVLLLYWRESADVGFDAIIALVLGFAGAMGLWVREGLKKALKELFQSPSVDSLTEIEARIREIMSEYVFEEAAA